MTYLKWLYHTIIIFCATYRFWYGAFYKLNLSIGLDDIKNNAQNGCYKTVALTFVIVS